MRAREFITEQQGELPATAAGPLQHTYFLPGVPNNNPYTTYRLSTAIARARADLDPAAEQMPPFTSVGAFAQNAIISGFNDNVEDVIDRALALMDLPGGKKLVSTPDSDEPEFVITQSPIKAFRGYK